MMEKDWFCFLLLLKATCKSGNLRNLEHMDEGQGVLTIHFAGVTN